MISISYIIAAIPFNCPTTPDLVGPYISSPYLPRHTGEVAEGRRGKASADLFPIDDHLVALPLPASPV
jgi:hypothetical protein